MTRCGVGGIIHSMSETQTIIQSLGALSYVGIFGVSILANVVIPVPEEIVLLALGFLVGTGQVNGYIIIGILIAGLFISDFCMYYFAKKGFKFVNFFYEKFFAKRLASKRDWLESHVPEVIFFSRFLVQLRFLGPFLAGQTKTPTKTFVKYNLYALTVYVPFYILVGFYFHNRIEVISSGIVIARNLIIMAMALIAVFSISKFAHDLIFGGYILSRKGTPEEKTWIPYLYKIKR